LAWLGDTGLPPLCPGQAPGVPAGSAHPTALTGPRDETGSEGTRQGHAQAAREPCL